MYQRYADGQSWKISHLSESAAENGGLKEAIVQVDLQRLFLHLLNESPRCAEGRGGGWQDTSSGAMLMIMAWHLLWLSHGQRPLLQSWAWTHISSLSMPAC